MMKKLVRLNEDKKNRITIEAYGGCDSNSCSCGCYTYKGSVNGEVDGSLSPQQKK